MYMNRCVIIIINHAQYNLLLFFLFVYFHINNLALKLIDLPNNVGIDCNPIPNAA